VAYPTNPPVAYSYSGFQASSPTTPLPANQVDNDLAQHKLSIDSIITFVKQTFTSVGKAAASSVDPASLSAATVSLIGGWNPRGAWANATAYAVRDMVSSGGNNYVANTAHTSSGSIDLVKFTLIAATGATGTTGTTGTTGATGAGYTATSTTSLTMALGLATFTTQAGLAYTPGARVRASSVADSTVYLEGVVTSYSGTTLVIAADVATSSTVVASWNINIAGTPASSAAVTPAVRQTVSGGPVTAAGLPNFLPATAASLSLTTQNVTSLAPLTATAANGWSGTTGASLDAPGYSVVNLTWTGLTASRAAATPNYLYGAIANGVITPASTLLAPVYQWGGTPAVTLGQITFNIAEMKAYLGNGATAPQTNLVVFGEAATDATTVISTVAYAYNGRYESALTLALPGSATSLNHNIGVTPRRRQIVFECATAEFGYTIGQQIVYGEGVWTYDGAANTRPPCIVSSGKTIAFAPSSGGGYNVTNPSTGAFQQPITSANWKYKATADRGW
jgi:hypothetical protein